MYTAAHAALPSRLIRARQVRIDRAWHNLRFSLAAGFAALAVWTFVIGSLPASDKHPVAMTIALLLGVVPWFAGASMFQLDADQSKQSLLGKHYPAGYQSRHSLAV